MSWEAVTWASKQRMKLPQEQLVLLVLANCADPSGVAFAEWPGREHWWKYLVARTRLSKSSLFRHLNTLVELKLCTRSMMVLADGTRRPTLRLDLSSAFDIEEIERNEADHSHEQDQSHGETGAGDAPEHVENDSDFSDSGETIGTPAIRSHGETGPTGGTSPFPIVGMHIDSSIDCSKESPPTPQVGGSHPDDGWEEFRSAWARPIERPSVARSAWQHVPTAKRGEVITAARGYFVWISRQAKPPPTVSAQTFIRESSGWSQWLPYVGAVSSTSASLAYARDSVEAKALAVLHDIAGIGEAFRKIYRRSDGTVSYRLPITPRIAALAASPAISDWPALTHNQAAAWEGVLREAVTIQVRKHLKDGDHAPWPWPPRKDGTLSPDTPSPTMTPDDVEAFAKEGTR